MAKIMMLTATAVAMLVAQQRAVSVDLVCNAGCLSADSLEVVTALRAGLAQSKFGASGGRAVMVRGRVESSSARSGPIATAPVSPLPLSVTGRISLEAGQVRLAAEFFEGQRAVARDTLLVSREDMPVQVKRLGVRLGTALSER
jgi:hypothetical protein